MNKYHFELYNSTYSSWNLCSLKSNSIKIIVNAKDLDGAYSKIRNSEHNRNCYELEKIEIDI